MSAIVAGHVHGADVDLTEAPTALARLRSFHTLDALRGIAAASVVLFHAAFFYGLASPAEGQLAVDLFFVMSGFIIAYRYEADLVRGMTLGTFLKIRLVRLYPLFILGTLLGALPAIVAVAGGEHDQLHEGLVKSLPFALLMLPTQFAMPRIEELYPLNYVAWSLVLELAINLVYAATFHLWTVRRLLVVLAISFVGLCICAGVYGRLKYGYAWPEAPVGFVRVVYGFAMGVLIFRLFAAKAIAWRVPWWSLLVVSTVLFIFPPPEALRQIWEVGAIAVVVPCIVAAAVANEPPRSLQGTCAVAGIFSYVLYSLHAPFIGLFLRGEELLHVDRYSMTGPREIVFSVLLVAACLAAHFLYDKPVRRFLTRHFVGRRTSVAR